MGANWTIGGAENQKPKKSIWVKKNQNFKTSTQVEYIKMVETINKNIYRELKLQGKKIMRKQTYWTVGGASWTVGGAN